VIKFCIQEEECLPDQGGEGGKEGEGGFKCLVILGKRKKNKPLVEKKKKVSSHERCVKKEKGE